MLWAGCLFLGHCEGFEKPDGSVEKNSGNSRCSGRIIMYGLVKWLRGWLFVKLLSVLFFRSPALRQ